MIWKNSRAFRERKEQLADVQLVDKEKALRSV
jgi:hypothetical protein